MTKILFITSSKNGGGAEKQLSLLANELRKYYEVGICVISNNSTGNIDFRESCSEYFEINKGVLFQIFYLRNTIKIFKPDIIINWLYKADVLGSIIAKFENIEVIINSARNTDWPNRKLYKLFILRFASKYFAKYIVANSEYAQNWHANIGFPPNKIVVIPNILDLNSLESNNVVLDTDEEFRFRIGIASRAVIGKGHFEVAKALAQDDFLRDSITVSFIGQGIPEWHDLELYLMENLISYELLPFKNNLESWFQSLNLYVALSTSWESDSNSLLEAILHEVEVLCSTIQNTKELIPKPKVIDPRNAAEIQNALKYFVNRTDDNSKELLSRRDNLIKSRDKVKILKMWIELMSRSKES